MGTWLAMIITPLIALANQSVAYALVSWSCSQSNTLVPDLVFAASFAACLLLTLSAGQEWRWAQGKKPTSEVGDPARRRRDMSLVAVFTGALSSLIVLA